MYGHTYDSDCDAYCNECGERRDPPHAYDNACDTNCNLCNETRDTKHSYKATVINPTCNTDGSTTYTCRHCGDSYTESIPATGHTYDNACDADCNVCGAIRQVPHHVYDDAYDATCNECGEVREVPERPGDANGDGNVNARDLVLLQQFMAGWDVPFSFVAADVDGNGYVVARDLALLQQYVAGWDVELG